MSTATLLWCGLSVMLVAIGCALRPLFGGNPLWLALAGFLVWIELGLFAELRRRRAAERARTEELRRNGGLSRD